MHITIDTNNITPEDRVILALILDGGTGRIADALTEDGQTATPADEPEKPKRTRRTKAQIAADEEAAKAAEQEKTEPADEPTPDSENAESDAVEDKPTPEPTLDTGDSISMEELKELATKLISSDRSAMVELLKQFGARRLSEIPEGDWGKFASEIRAKLKD